VIIAKESGEEQRFNESRVCGKEVSLGFERKTCAEITKTVDLIRRGSKFLNTVISFHPKTGQLTHPG